MVFVILHLLVYPASNGYNSYFDRDEGPIGALKQPPRVEKPLYWVSLTLDGIAIVLALTLGWVFALMVLTYGLVSKAYSHPSIRLKKYPFVGWLVIGLFQGFFTVMMVKMGVSQMRAVDMIADIPESLLATLLLLGSYPMTQVYQHTEDQKRGDITLSIRLGVRGTFLFSGLVFFMAAGAFFYYFHLKYPILIPVIFLVSQLPVVVFFAIWVHQVFRDEKQADFRQTMRLNMITSVMLNLFFGGLLWFQNS